MPARLSLFALLLLLSLATTVRLQAQVPDSARTPLPDIAPREIEIRGQLEFSFPSLERQPLVGFNPPPRVPLPPEGRRPYVEAEAGSSFAYNPLPRPEPPSARSGIYPPAQGFVEASTGRYFSRGARGHFTAPVMEDAATFLTSLTYQGLDGRRPFEDPAYDPDLHTPFDLLEGQLGLATTDPRWDASLVVGGMLTEYDLYGWNPATFPFSATPATRNGRDLYLAGRLHTLTRSTFQGGLDVKAQRTAYTSRLPGPTSTQKTTRTESRWQADATLRTDTWWADGNLDYGVLGDDQGHSLATQPGAGTRLQLNPNTTLRLGGRFLGAFSRTAPGGQTLRKGYLSPEILLEHFPQKGLRLYAGNHPVAEAHSLADVLRTHPYLVPDPTLRPSLHSIAVEMGGDFFQGSFQVNIQAGYRRSPQRLYFESLPDEGLTFTRYDKATVAHVGGKASVGLAGGLQAMIGARYQHGRLPDEVPIPYFAPVVAETAVSFPFAQSKGLFQVTGTFESARYIDTTHTRKVDPYLNIGAEASYALTQRLGLVARLDNLTLGLNEQWDHYPITSEVFSLGMYIHW